LILDLEEETTLLKTSGTLAEHAIERRALEILMNGGVNDWI
jgi:hypothetical protein